MTATTSRVGHQSVATVGKAPALRAGDRVGVFAPASPAEENRISLGVKELRSLGFTVVDTFVRDSQAYFSAGSQARIRDFLSLLNDPDISALFASRGGYGSNYMLESLWAREDLKPKCIVGYSDATSLQVLLWQRFRWVTFYGPMVAAGLDAGANAAKGYGRASLEAAIFGSSAEWRLDLSGSEMVSGTAEGRILGGCLTLIETTLGTPWELDAANCILLLEDRGMKPWQVDRALMHLMQAGKFQNVKGIVLGEFPDCEPPVSGSPTAREVCERILKPLGVPIVWGAAVGHTPRPMLTIPLGIRAKLVAEGEGTLEFLETAVIP